MRNLLSTTLVAALSVTSALAAPLTGTSGTITLPGTTGALSSAPGTVATTTTVGADHTGTWTAPVDPAWIGTYDGTGPIPSGANACNCVARWILRPSPIIPSSSARSNVNMICASLLCP